MGSDPAHGRRRRLLRLRAGSGDSPASAQQSRPPESSRHSPSPSPSPSPSAPAPVEPARRPTPSRKTPTSQESARHGLAAAAAAAPAGRAAPAGQRSSRDHAEPSQRPASTANRPAPARSSLCPPSPASGQTVPALRLRPRQSVANRGLADISVYVALRLEIRRPDISPRLRGKRESAIDPGSAETFRPRGECEWKTLTCRPCGRSSLAGPRWASRWRCRPCGGQPPRTDRRIRGPTGRSTEHAAGPRPAAPAVDERARWPLLAWPQPTSARAMVGARLAVPRCWRGRAMARARLAAARRRRWRWPAAAV